MRARRGFTLIELMVAIVLSGVVALLAYGSVEAGIDSASRIESYRRNGESEAMMRALVGDALRHPADTPPGAAAFQMTVGPNGASDLRFMSRGINGPLGAGDLWQVGLRPTNSGIELDAISLDGDASPIHGTIAGLSSFAVRVRGLGDQNWQDRWESTQQFPSAVEIVFRDSAGVSRGAPLTVGTALESR